MICWFFGHRWKSLNKTAKQLEEEYQEWFDDYPVGVYPTHKRCERCGEEM